MRKITTFLILFLAFSVQAQLRLVKDINTSSATSGSNPLSLYEYNGFVLFTCKNADSNANRYVYFTDGTSEGTANMLNPNDLPLVNPNTTMYFYKETGGTGLYFDAIDPANSHNSLMYTNSPSGSATLMDIYSKTLNVNSRFGPAARIGSYLVFSPLGDQNVEPLVRGTNNIGSGILKDINFGNAVSSTPTNFVNFANKVFFSAESFNEGREIWSTDGTTAGTTLYLDVLPGTNDSAPDYFNVIGSTLYLVAKNASSGRELRSTNGVSGALSLVKDINPSGDSNPTNVKLIGSTLYFSANDGTNGAELWKSDGTNAGTVLVKNINTTVGQGSNPSDFTQVGSLVYFLTDNTSGGKQLWKTDGTTAGTTLVTNVSVVPETITNLTAYNGKLYFVKMAATAIKTLWVSNGTAAGTLQLFPGAVNDSGLVVMNEELYFGYTGTTGGMELYAYKDPALATIGFEESAQFEIVPNPVQDAFELTGNSLINTVSIYTLQGQLVSNYTQQSSYDVSALPSGNYLVKVVATSGSSTLKLVKN